MSSENESVNPTDPTIDSDGAPAFGPAPTQDTLDRDRVRGAVKGRLFDEVVRPATIGRFAILDRLGSGGMGVVYAAYDPELDRKVAIKLLRTDSSGRDSTEAQARLFREAQALAKLSHPNVITVHDVGTHDGRVFVAMEFIDGQTIGGWLESEERSWRDVLDVFLHAGRGLAAAHSAGLVHRDFKPDNVMIESGWSRQGTEAGRVRVLDFGLARPNSEPTEESSPQPTSLGPSSDALVADLTRTGAVIGTPAYMAPEQYHGLTSDARTDQFSFCVSLWEGLYGGRPFIGETAPSLAFNIIKGNFSEVPAKTSVPGWLRPLLKRGLSSDPSDRWPDLATLLRKLERGAARRRHRRRIDDRSASEAVAGPGARGGGALHGWARTSA